MVDGERDMSNTGRKEEGEKPHQVRAPKSAPHSTSPSNKTKKRETLYSLTNAADPANSPDPRSPATGADDDRVGAVEGDKAV